MKYERTTVSGDVMILANDHYVGKPITLDFDDVEGGVVKAGTPMAATGVVATTTPGVEDAPDTSDAVGILFF